MSHYVNTEHVTKILRTTHYIALSPTEQREFFHEHMRDLVDEDILQDHKFPDQRDGAHKLGITMMDNGWLRIEWPEDKEAPKGWLR